MLSERQTYWRRQRLLRTAYGMLCGILFPKTVQSPYSLAATQLSVSMETTTPEQDGTVKSRPFTISTPQH